jgi:hypothetical protein
MPDMCAVIIYISKGDVASFAKAYAELFSLVLYDIEVINLLVAPAFHCEDLSLAHLHL